ncbi:MAG: diguanylate cyclase [Thermodesulfobacteriota bacterium]
MRKPSAAPSDPRSDLAGQGITVLLVDDQPMIAEAVRRALAEAEDIAFHYCSDPTQALKVATQVRPTVILQDLVMPELDGLMMLRFFRVHAETAQVPVIVLSVREEPKVKSEAFAVGANDYLVKLPDKIELIARIRYHSRAYINQLERDAAFRALQRSQEELAAAVDQLAEANRSLQRLSSLDGLTGIANRRRFDDVLHQEWHRAMRQGSSLALILLDIDFFKLFNDNYGHQRGDDCLRQVAGVLERSMRRDADLAARYGGEEFAAILPNSDETGGLAVAKAMQANLRLLQIPHAKSRVSDHVTISVGVSATVPRRDTEPELLVAAADRGLYQAKEEGRDRICPATIDWPQGTG